MSDCTANGNAVLRGNIKLPYEGAITAELELDASERLTGAVSLVLLGRTFSMSVVADPAAPEVALSGDSGGFFRARLVAGAGGLETRIEPQEWPQGVSVQQILTVLLTASGEGQAADISADLLSRVLPQWSFVQGTVRDALSALAQYLEVLWRIRDDGLVWLGTPAPARATPPEYILTEILPESGQAEWDLNEAGVSPDQIIDGLTLRQVVYAWTPGSLRALVTYAPGPVSGLFGLFGQWTKRIGLDFFRAVSGRIAEQNFDGSLQFQPDDSRYSPLRRVGMRLGLPDTSVQVNPSSRGVAHWEGAQPSAPVLDSFGESTASKIRFAASATPKPVARQGDAVGYLFFVIANVVGVPVVTAVGWSPTILPPPFVPSPGGSPAPGSYYQALSITSGSSIVEAGG